MQLIWIDQPAQLAGFCAQIRGQDLAVDTESDHFHAYHPRVCLIQIATADVAAFIDPLALPPAALAPLFELLENPKTTTLLHAANNDIRELNRDFGTSIANVFDTQIAAEFLGYERFSLSWLQENVLHKTPPAQCQRYDWTTRPIPPAVSEYAMADVTDLFNLRAQFLPELEHTGWLDAFHQQCTWVAATSFYEPSAFDPEGWWRLLSRAPKDFDARARAALRELYPTRHHICSTENRAALHIFPNQAIFKIARTRPQTPADLRRLRALDHHILDTWTPDILDAVKRSLRAEAPPARRPKSRDTPLHLTPETLCRALIDWRNSTADRLGIPGALIATNATLTDIACDPPDTVDGLDAFPAILAWQRDLLGDEILNILRRAQ